MAGAIKNFEPTTFLSRAESVAVIFNTIMLLSSQGLAFNGTFMDFGDVT